MRSARTRLAGASRFPPEHVPRQTHVDLGRARVADREPQHVTAVQLRVRDEDLAARVHSLEERFVLLFRSVAAEAHERERPWRSDLPAWGVADPSLEQGRE